MSLPLGFKYLNNMALYLFTSLREAYIEDYGINLEIRYDRVDQTLYKVRIFCLDCATFKTCKGKFWKACPNRAKALRIIRGNPLKSNGKEELDDTNQ